MISKKTTDFWKAAAIIIVTTSHYFGWLAGEEHFLSTIGPFGVDIFFLLSGYGLACSAGKQGINLHFIQKRICSVYIPYLLVAGTINLLYDDLSGITRAYWIKYFTGYDYWFLNILFVFYLSFMIIYKIFKKDAIRLVFMTVFVILYSVRLYRMGRSDFWTLSNAAFLFGIYGATLEKSRPWLFQNKRLCGILFVLSVTGSFCFFQALQKLRFLDTKLAYSYEMYCNLLFSVAILLLLYILPIWDYAFCFLGKYTLYIYLTHSVIFWQTYPYLPKSLHTVLRAVISFLVTCLLSALIGLLYSMTSRVVIRITRRLTS